MLKIQEKDEHGQEYAVRVIPRRMEIAKARSTIVHPLDLFGSNLVRPDAVCDTTRTIDGSCLSGPALYVVSQESV